MSSRINASDLSQRAEEILSKVRESRERYVIEESGKPIAAVVSIDDLARLEESLPSPKPNVTEALAALKDAEAIREMIRRERGASLCQTLQRLSVL